MKAKTKAALCLLLTLTLLLFGKAAFSQAYYPGGKIGSILSDLRDNMDTGGNGGQPLQFKLLSEISYGFRLNGKSAPFKTFFGDSPQFTINAIEVTYFPTDQLGVSLGADFRLDTFGSKTSAFGVETESGQIILSDVPSGLDSFYSRAAVMGASFPLRASVKLGYFKVMAGAELNWNMKGNTRQIAKAGNATTTQDIKKATIKPLSFDLSAALYFYNFGLYFKIYPQGSPVIPDYGRTCFHFNSYSLGVTLDL